MPFTNLLVQGTGLLLVLLLVTGMAFASKTSKPKGTNTHLAKTHSSSRHHSSKHSAKKTLARSHGQRTIDEERTRAIQAALIREHYLSGEPSGVMDQSTHEALVRYQAANGWQTKITPDSRALIKLGLGPDHKGLLNPETAVIASPHELGVGAEAQPGGASNQE